MVSQDVRAARKEARAAELPLYQDPAFWVRVAEDPKFREVVSNGEWWDLERSRHH